MAIQDANLGWAVNEVGGTRPAQQVGHFRQILLWPVHLAVTETRRGTDPAALLASIGAENPWREVDDEFTRDPTTLQERHYNEFVTFLPPVQRFLYGEGSVAPGPGGSGRKPITVMRRLDIVGVRLTLTESSAPLTLNIAHIDLYFFFDIDIAILAIELFADDLPLATAEELVFRLGRAYPAYWDENGRAGHCPVMIEWLAADGSVTTASDYDERQSYLTFVGKHRSARIARHWEYILAPMVPMHAGREGPLVYRQLEYYRMPVMAFLALKGETPLSRADCVRLTFASGALDTTLHPVSRDQIDTFEARYCYDLHHHLHTTERAGVRYMTCGHNFIVAGSASDKQFLDPDHGRLGAFRHQHFLLFLIAHFHKAALLMFSDRLAEAVSRLDIGDVAAVRTFRTATRRELETFLRFSHRYWFHVISNQAEAHDLFAMCRSHLEVDRLYAEIREEIQEMSQYLENDASRRQNETMKRLTVVTTFGLIGTTVTGFLGMNLFAWADQPSDWRTAAFLIVTAIATALTLVTIAKSRQLSDILDALSDENTSLARRIASFGRIFQR